MGAPDTTPTTAPTPRKTEPPAPASDGTPREARLSIPALGLNRQSTRSFGIKAIGNGRSSEIGSSPVARAVST